MIVLGLDPGTEISAVVVFNGVSLEEHVIRPNEHMLGWLDESRQDLQGRHEPLVLVIELFESFGMSVGREVFTTVRWSGRFEQVWQPGRVEWMPRRTVKQHICHTARATDANIRQELLDRFGRQGKAIGNRKTPGPLHGVKAHEWSALAIAVTWFDQHGHEPEHVRPGIPADF